MKTEKTLSKAKIALILNHPFFASLVLKHTFEPTETVPTIATNGITMLYNPAWVNSLSHSELTAVLAHEAMHVALCHHTRRGSRDPQHWNIAADYAINQILVDAGLTLPEEGLIDSQYQGMTAEKIYSKRNQDGNEVGNNPDPGGMGEVRDFPGDVAQEEQDQKINLQNAARTAKMAGKLSGRMDRLVSDFTETKIPWREVLARFLTEKIKSDYTWSRPNPRFVPSGIYLPVMESKETGTICLMIDTSGSQDDYAIQRIISEVHSMLSILTCELVVLYIDTQVNRVERYSAFDQPDPKPKGGGGTDFRPGFDWIRDQGEAFAGAVYFTDGYCDRFPDQIGVPVLWILNEKNPTFRPPFGEVIHQ